MNVLEALYKRLDIVFKEFDNVYISFSGGKDSGLLLNLVIKYMRERNITKKVGVMHQDFEAQYQETTKYVERTLTKNLDILDVYWICLPVRSKTSTSMFQQYWIPWEESKKDIWVRDMPEYEGVRNIDNNPFDFFKEGMLQEDFYKKFGGWYGKKCGGGKTIGLVGIRMQESLNRWRAINAEKSMYKEYKWTTKDLTTKEEVYTCYPLFDWKTEDIWIANAKFGFDYNRIYDLFYYAGVKIHDMRVASPFNEWAMGSLHLYRTIDPNTWAKMVGRVNGANFTAIYGGTKMMAWKKIELPKGHTWKGYVEFLLKTLPKETREIYKKHIDTSIKFWKERGGVLSEETIEELKDLGIEHTVGSKTNYKTSKKPVTFETYPDNADVKEFSLVPSWKRIAICIFKNDTVCRYMGFSETKAQKEKLKRVMEKYRDL